MPKLNIVQPGVTPLEREAQAIAERFYSEGVQAAMDLMRVRTAQLGLKLCEYGALRQISGAMIHGRQWKREGADHA